MAYNDMGVFQPSESAYTNPGEYETTQRNIALSKGTYMAEMDKVYAQLNETARQFDLSYDLQKDVFGLEQEKFDFTTEMDTAKFLESIREFDVSSNLEQQKINIQGSQVNSLSDYYSQLGKSEKQNRQFDLVGAAGAIFKEDGIVDSIWDGISSWF